MADLARIRCNHRFDYSATICVSGRGRLRAGGGGGGGGIKSGAPVGQYCLESLLDEREKGRGGGGITTCWVDYGLE